MLVKDNVIPESAIADIRDQMKTIYFDGIPAHGRDDDFYCMLDTKYEIQDTHV